MRFLITGGLGLALLLITAVSAQDPSPVLDTSGQPLRRGVEYIIRPAVTDVGGPFTLVNRTDLCPLYVGQPNVTEQVLSVTFAPFNLRESVVLEGRDTKLTFSAVTICLTSTAWMVDSGAEVGGRRLIVAGEDNDSTWGFLANYFSIRRGVGGLYNIEWCPVALCPICRLRCGPLGNLFENGQLLAALDGNALPVEFVRAP